MKQPLRRLIGASASAAALITLSLLPALTAPTSAHAVAAPISAAAPDSGLDTRSIDRLGSCLASGGQGDVLFVFDTSGSLSKSSNGNPASDPGAERVAAASYLIDQLASYVDNAQGDVSIDVATAGFAVDFDGPAAGDWVALDAGTAGDVKDTIAGYRDLDEGFETDYWSAVDGARGVLHARDSGEGRRCQAWVWFSDGQLDLDARESDSDVERYGDTKPYGPTGLELTSDDAERRLEEAAGEALCRPGGVADALRGQGVITLAVGLRGAGSTNPPDYSVMRGVATGSGDCGRAPKQSPGLFVEASSVSDLYLAFDALSDPGTAPFSQVTPVCQGEICEAGRQRFVLDDSIDRINLLASSDADGYQAVLEPPGAGKPVALESGQDQAINLDGASGSVDWINDQVVRFELDKLPGNRGWRGQWSVAFVDPSSSSADMTAGTNLRLYGNLYPYLVDAGEPVAGETTEVTIGIRRGRESGEVVDPTKLGDVALDLALVYSDGTAIDPRTGLTAADLADPIKLDLSTASPGQAVIRLSLTVTTTDVTVGGQVQPGTTLEPRSVDEPLELLAPPAYPQVAGEVDFGSTEEAGSVTRSVKVEAKGCVWLDVKSVEVVSLPDGVAAAPVSSSAESEDSCVTGDLPVTIDLDEVGTGLASGSFQVLTRADGAEAGSPTIPVTVTYGMEVERPRDVERFLWALILITAAGILIPVALLYLVKWRTAQLAGRSLTIVSLSGDVGPDSSFLQQAQPREQDGRTVALDGNRRSVMLSGRAGLRARIGIGLTEPGFATVVGAPSAGSRAPSTTRSGLSARLPLAAQDSWVVLVDRANPTGPVEVLFVLSPTGGQLNNLLVDARSRVPETVARLRDKLGAGATPPAAGPGGPGGSGPGGGWGSGGWGGPAAAPPTPAAPAATPGDWGTSDGGWDSSPAPQTRPPGGGSDGW